MDIRVLPDRVLHRADAMIYGQFIEHFHRQIYGGLYDPGSPFADEDGFRLDVLEALREIHVPVMRWPGGCFVSNYGWRGGVGPERKPFFDRAWRVEEPNTFGTDEFLRYCEKLNCAPYICTNAGTGTEWEMGEWVEYCNLPDGGPHARLRMANGRLEPYNVRYWSIGNENYLPGEIGAKSPARWATYVAEAAKIMQRTDPGIELSAAAVNDLDWNTALLRHAGHRLKWISLHHYWDPTHGTTNLAPYSRCMAYTLNLDSDIQKARGLLTAMGLEKRIRIAFDEWNLRGWYHPQVESPNPEDYLKPRDRNDDNASYTMADAVFTACFLNTMLRNADIVGMANYAPAVNTRGLIYTHEKGIVKRSTYHVFWLYTNELYRDIVDAYSLDALPYEVDGKDGPVSVDCVDYIVTRDDTGKKLAAALVNKHAEEPVTLRLDVGADMLATMKTLDGSGCDAYNDVNSSPVLIRQNDEGLRPLPDGKLEITLPPHSVNVVTLVPK